MSFKLVISREWVLKTDSEHDTVIETFMGKKSDGFVIENGRKGLYYLYDSPGDARKMHRKVMGSEMALPGLNCNIWQT